jgi:hypothetical protein
MSVLRKNRARRGYVRALGALVLVTSGCEKVYFREYDFHSADVTVADGLPVTVALGSVTWVISDSAGFYMESRANPYSIFVYVDSSSTAAVEQVTLELIGLQSGAVLTPALSPLARLAESNKVGRSAATAHDLELAYEDYTARMHITIRDASGVREEERTTTLHRKFIPWWSYKCCAHWLGAPARL